MFKKKRKPLLLGCSHTLAKSEARDIVFMQRKIKCNVQNLFVLTYSQSKFLLLVTAGALSESLI